MRPRWSARGRLAAIATARCWRSPCRRPPPAVGVRVAAAPPSLPAASATARARRSTRGRRRPGRAPGAGRARARTSGRCAAVSRDLPPGSIRRCWTCSTGPPPTRKRTTSMGVLACAEEAARQAPRSVEAHHNRALALMRLGRFDEARDALALALASRPTIPSAWSWPPSCSSTTCRPAPSAPPSGWSTPAAAGRRTAARATARARPGWRCSRVRPWSTSGARPRRWSRSSIALQAQPAATCRPATSRAWRCSSCAASTPPAGPSRRCWRASRTTPTRFTTWRSSSERRGREDEADTPVRRGLPARSQVVPARARGVAEDFAARVRRGPGRLPADVRQDLATVPIETAELPAPEDLTAERPPLSPTILGLFRGLAARPRGRRRGGRPRAAARAAPRGRQAASGQRLRARREGPALRRRRCPPGPSCSTGATSCAASTAPTISTGPSSGPCCTRWATCEARTTARCATEDSSDSHAADPLLPSPAPRDALPSLPLLLAAAGGRCSWPCPRRRWPRTRRPAARHWDRGQELYKQGRFLEAAREFEAGYQVAPRSLFLLNIGHSYRRAQELRKAKAAYETLLKIDPTSAAPADGRGSRSGPSTTR